MKETLDAVRPFFTDYGIWISLGYGVAGLVFALLLIPWILRASPGSERMRQIGSAIEEGAKAYLNRQILSISLIAVLIFILLICFKDRATTLGFLIGGICSLLAGYIGMRIAVTANTRTANAA